MDVIEKVGGDRYRLSVISYPLSVIRYRYLSNYAITPINR